MRDKATLPVGLTALGTTLIALGWISGLALTGAGIGCIAAGLLTLVWRVGRHFECA
jgi:hypothetical protein